MGMLGRLFPLTQFFITGVLGPQSNAQKLTASVAVVLAGHGRTIAVSG